ncbi:MAG: sulfite exporter TauE/SafE family protein [Candidatus Omnitrophica bacterium]|nr:sulfite exporter TauE/SafE family protein [Candidatus Omnitrophota bacterium]
MQLSPDNISIFTYITVFVFGILICFTPCVYPIIPVIVSCLGTANLKSKTEIVLRSLSYVLGLAIVYAVLGAVAALSGELFGSFQHSFWTRFIIANIFILMGLFMLEVFIMPQFSLIGKTKSRNLSGAVGVFLTGALSGLVVGPCSTPVLGGILTYVASKQNIFLGISLLFVYALGMSFPLLILGIFVGLLKKMPRSGQWMEKIKKLFGLILIGVGEYFLLGGG